MSSYDVVVVGGGHNGLVTAALLGRRGLSVLVLEQRDRLGGVAEVLPTAGRLRQSVIDELGLAGHGLEMVRPAVRMLALRDDGPPIAFHGDAARTAESLSTVSAADAAAYPGYDRHVRALSGFLAEMHRMTPPRLDRITAGDLAGGLRLGRAFRRLGERTARELTRALPMAAADFVREWFEHDAVCGALVARGTLMTAMGPWSSGSTLTLLADMAEGDGGPAGEAAHIRGGVPALVGALRAAAEAAGAEIRTGAAVRRILADDDGVGGVELAGGERVVARAVASSAGPRTTLVELLDPEITGPRMRWRANTIRARGHVAAVELDLSELPAFTGVDDPALLQGRIVVAPGIDHLERAFDASKYGETSERPQIEAVIPTLLDPGARPGHTLRALVQWVPAHVDPDIAGDLLVEELERHAPGVGGLVTDRRVVTPAGLEREYGLPGGHLLHAEPGLDQFFAWRPVLGLARYRLGIRGLYLCGSGAHPGGGLTGGPGENAAREIARDLAR